MLIVSPAEVSDQPGSINDGATGISSGVPYIVHPERMATNGVLLVLCHRLVGQFCEVQTTDIYPAARSRASPSPEHTYPA